MNNGEASED